MAAAVHFRRTDENLLPTRSRTASLMSIVRPPASAEECTPRSVIPPPARARPPAAPSRANYQQDRTRSAMLLGINAPYLATISARLR